MKRRRYTKQLGLLVPDHIHERVEKICDDKEIPISVWLREVIEEKLMEETEDGE